MAESTWLSAIGHFVSDVVGTMFGVSAIEARKKAAEATGAELKRVLMPNRGEIMREILYLGDEVKALHDLLVEAERGKGFVVEGGKRYFENWMINMLLKIDPRDRSWVFRLLNEVLVVRGRKEFFTHLEILYDDGWLQYLRLARLAFEDGIKKVRGKLPEFSEKTENWAANTAAPRLREKDQEISDHLKRFGDWMKE